MSLRVGSGTGPEMLTPVFSAIFLTCPQTSSNFVGLVPESRILAFWFAMF
jgi:hypothetical protein